MVGSYTYYLCIFCIYSSLILELFFLITRCTWWIMDLHSDTVLKEFTKYIKKILKGVMMELLNIPVLMHTTVWVRMLNFGFGNRHLCILFMNTKDFICCTEFFKQPGFLIYKKILFYSMDYASIFGFFQFYIFYFDINLLYF